MFLVADAMISLLRPRPCSITFQVLYSRRSAARLFSRDSQTLRLTDGRTLGFAEYGDPEGYPILFFHGFPLSRLSASGGDREARDRKIRLICPDRPGFGLSTFAPHRRITDWTKDTYELVDHLAIRKFSIIGGSGGGPYALTCAKDVSRERLTSVAVFVGAPPWHAPVPNPRSDMSRLAKITYAGVWYWPRGMTLLLKAMLRSVRWLIQWGPAKGRIENMLQQAAEKERERAEKDGLPQDEDDLLLTPSQRRENTMRIYLDGFARGVEGTIHEARLLTRHWGFEFEEVKCDNLIIWHGSKDTNAPIRYTRYMAEKLPYATLREFPEDDHYTMANRWAELLDEVMSISVEHRSHSAESGSPRLR